MASSPRTQAYISGVIPYHRTRAGRNTSQVKDTLIAEIETQHHPGLIPCKPRVHCATQTETDLKSNAQLKQKWDLFSLVAIGVSVEQQEHLWRLQPCKSKRTPLKEEVKKAKKEEQSAKSVPQLTHILLCLWVSMSNWDVFKVVFGNQTARCSRVANASSKKETQKKDAAGCLCDSVTLIQDLEETFDIVPRCCQNTSLKLLPVCFFSPRHHI